MIQGGDPTGTGMGGSKQTIKGEFASNGVKNYLAHDRGVISMARTMAPNSASSQFFICHEEASHLNGAYASFGVLIDGFDTLDEIANAETDQYDMPLKDQKIATIRRA
jgi:peptidyl-prolyl cis-trans isomerase B (cyclophilin B)